MYQKVPINKLIFYDFMKQNKCKDILTFGLLYSIINKTRPISKDHLDERHLIFYHLLAVCFSKSKLLNKYSDLE